MIECRLPFWPKICPCSLLAHVVRVARHRLCSGIGVGLHPAQAQCLRDGVLYADSTAAIKASGFLTLHGAQCSASWQLCLACVASARGLGARQQVFGDYFFGARSGLHLMMLKKLRIPVQREAGATTDPPSPSRELTAAQVIQLAVMWGG